MPGVTYHTPFIPPIFSEGSKILPEQSKNYTALVGSYFITLVCSFNFYYEWWYFPYLCMIFNVIYCAIVTCNRHYTVKYRVLSSLFLCDFFCNFVTLFWSGVFSCGSIYGVHFCWFLFRYHFVLFWFLLLFCTVRCQYNITRVNR